jgi:hypothetical protein
VELLHIAPQLLGGAHTEPPGRRFVDPIFAMPVDQRFADRMHQPQDRVRVGASECFLDDRFPSLLYDLDRPSKRTRVQLLANR